MEVLIERIVLFTLRNGRVESYNLHEDEYINMSSGFVSMCGTIGQTQLIGLSNSLSLPSPFTDVQFITSSTLADLSP